VGPCNSGPRYIDGGLLFFKDFPIILPEGLLSFPRDARIVANRGFKFSGSMADALAIPSTDTTAARILLVHFEGGYC